jgi:putative tributyrin esterase
MPLIHCDFFSEALKVATAMDVILPLAGWGGTAAGAGNEHPVLYLLHGLSDDHTIWQRRTSIERYLEGLDLAVVMPAVHRSFYADMAAGYHYWTFISQEVPYVAHSLFQLSTRREDTFVAGLSMGGYGAFKLALTFPERFAAAASLSGALDVGRLALDPKNGWLAEASAIFGDPARVKGSGNDLFTLAKKLAASKGPKPRLYQWCGTEDHLYKDNLRFRKQAQKLGLELDYAESPGTHEWKYWDQQIQVVLQWLAPKKINPQQE